MNAKSVFLAVFSLTIATGLSAEEPSVAPESVVIPLDRVWALNMPGTRDIHNLEPSVTTHQPEFKRLLPEIIKAISPYEKKMPPEMTIQEPGFAIAVADEDALSEVYSILVSEMPRVDTITVDDDVSLVFFAGEFTQDVKLEKIERDGHTIKVSYSFVPRLEKFMSSQLAIIPIGKLPNAGEYKVNFDALPIDARLRIKGWQPIDEKVRKTIISQPFAFQVESE